MDLDQAKALRGLSLPTGKAMQIHVADPPGPITVGSNMDRACSIETSQPSPTQSLIPVYTYR